LFPSLSDVNLSSVRLATPNFAAWFRVSSEELQMAEHPTVLIDQVDDAATSPPAEDVVEEVLVEEVSIDGMCGVY